MIVLQGNSDAFSNGINLNQIEASSDKRAEAWANINAINDVINKILTTSNKVFLSAVEGSAGAGGVAQAIAADHVIARSSSMLNMHYKGMGLYGSEYWTYSLEKRVGKHYAQQVTELCEPLTSA